MDERHFPSTRIASSEKAATPALLLKPQKPIGTGSPPVVIFVGVRRRALREPDPERNPQAVLTSDLASPPKLAQHGQGGGGMVSMRGHGTNSSSQDFARK